MTLRILCSNDDGIHAPGLGVLERIAREISDDVWVVAPETEMSGAARALTISSPLRLRKVSERKFAVSGTPSDSVVMALEHVLKDKAPDLILSGVNNGQNLAEDVTVSGTIAAAFMGMTHGVPSIALSLARFAYDRARWRTAEVHAPSIIRKLLEVGWPKDVVMNVNFPDVEAEAVTEIEVTRQGFRDVRQLMIDERTDLRGRSYYWFGFRGQKSDPPDGTDLRAIYDGRISITPLHLQLTHEESRKTLDEAISGPPLIDLSS